MSEKGKSAVFGIATIAINTVMLAVFSMMVLYYYLYVSLPKDKLLSYLIVVTGVFGFMLYRSLILKLKDNKLSFHNPLLLKTLLKVELDNIHSLKYAKKAGRSSVPSFEVSYLEEGVHKHKIIDGHFKLFEIRRLQKHLGHNLSIIITDW